jgi:hypothetical protein
MQLGCHSRDLSKRGRFNERTLYKTQQAYID